MNKRQLLYGLCFTLCLNIEAQVALKGIAVKMNSSFSPVSGVEIYASGATPTLTDGAGAFAMQLPYLEAGDLLLGIQIRKRGMEVVNQKEIEQWIVSGDIFYRIVLCPQGYIEENRRRFYNIGKDYYQKEYERKLAELKQECNKQSTDVETFEQSLQELNTEYDKRMRLLDYYAEKFARINKDELSDMERKAISLLEQGDINGAIHVYEESGIVEQFRKKVTERDSLVRSLEVTHRLLRQQIEWYGKEGSFSSMQKKEQLEQLLNQMQKITPK